METRRAGQEPRMTGQTDDEVIVVVGAGGLGRACIEHLAQQGNVLAADIDPKALEPFGAEHPQVETLLLPDAEHGTAQKVIDALAPRRLAGLVHAVGINDRRPVLDLSEADVLQILQVNLVNAFSWGQAAGRVMCAQNHGSIVFFSSVSERSAHPHHSAYAASKGGLRQLARVMAREWAPHGVRVNCIAPSYTETALTAEHLSRGTHREDLQAQVPMGRLGQTDDVVGAVEFLLGDSSRFVTGQSLHVDGGRGLL